MLWSVLQHELYAELKSYGQFYMFGYRSNFLVCPKLVLLWSVWTWIHAKLKFYGQLTLKSMVNSKFMLNFIFMAWCIARKEPTREGLVRVAMFFDTKWRRGPNVTVLLLFSLLQGNLCLKWNRTFHLMKMVTLTGSNYWRVVWNRPVRPYMLSFSDRRTWALKTQTTWKWLSLTLTWMVYTVT